MTPLALQLAALEEDKVTPGLLGFTVVAVLALATWFLLKSMNKQLKRVNFDETAGSRPAAEATDGEAAPDADADADRPAEDTDARETQGNGAK